MTDNPAQKEEITLFLTDDHESVTDGLRELVAQDSSLRVVGCCNDSTAVLENVRQLHPDVLVLDISMPGMNGLEVLQLVKSAVPSTHVVMLTMHLSENVVIDALRRGASGYLVKEAAAELCAAAHRVYHGGVYLSEGISKRVLEQFHQERAAVPVPAETVNS